MNIDQLLQLAKLLDNKQNSNSSDSENHFFKIGESYLIRTVTMIDIGRLEKVGDKELVLSSAAWIADTSRFSECLVTGKLGEVEPFPDGEVIIGRGAIIDAVIWTKPLPREVK